MLPQPGHLRQRFPARGQKIVLTRAQIADSMGMMISAMDYRTTFLRNQLDGLQLLLGLLLLGARVGRSAS